MTFLKAELLLILILIILFLLDSSEEDQFDEFSNRIGNIAAVCTFLLLINTIICIFYYIKI
jgi:hypothetical protein